MGSRPSEQHQNLRTQDLLYAGVFTAVLLVQLWKARQGMGYSDEQFYVTIGRRFATGDRMFADDWHIAQMIGFFLTPLYELYTAVHGGTDGILLGFRHYYVALTMFTGLMIYLRFRNEGPASILASLLYLVFTPFQIMSLSYNTMGAAAVILAMLVYPMEGRHPFRFYLCGILMACAVINTPYLIFLYLILTVITAAKPAWFSRSAWKGITAGALTIAVIFLMILWRNGSFENFSASLVHLIDPSHQMTFPEMAIRNGGKLYLLFGFFLIVFAAELILTLVLLKDPQKEQRLRRSSLWINLCSMVYAVCVSGYQMDSGTYAALLIPLCLSGLQALLQKKRIDLLMIYGVSVFYALMISLSSNVGPSSFCSPLILAGSVSCIAFSGREWNQLLVIAVISVFAFYKCSYVFGARISGYDAEIEDGPLKGLLDTEEAVMQYEHRLEDIREINAMEECSSVSLVTGQSWEYLACNKKIAANSTYLYFWEKDQYTAAEDAYACLHEDRYPAYIYVDHTDSHYFYEPQDSWLDQFAFVKNMQEGTLYIRNRSTISCTEEAK